MEKQTTTTGLRGVKAGSTSICTVGAEGHGLHYRGYAIEELAQNACFEEVVHLLLKGDLPSAAELDALRSQLQLHRQLPDLVVDDTSAIVTALGGVVVKPYGVRIHNDQDMERVYRIISEYASVGHSLDSTFRPRPPYAANRG